jgi:DNA-binding PadR family transcriptional regulator
LERELIILGLLRQTEMHGYRLIELVERDLHSSADLKKPTAYFLLNKLARAGLVSRSRARDGKRPPKWIYRLTPEGEARFQKLLRENLAAYPPAVFAIEAGLAFLDQLESAEAIELLRARRGILEGKLKESTSDVERRRAFPLVSSHQTAHLTAEVDWLSDLISRMESEVLSGAKPRHA